MRHEMNRRYSILILSLAVIGCGKTADPEGAENSAVQPAPVQPEVPPARQSDSPTFPENDLSDSIDPKGPAGAKAVLGRYAKLVGQQRWAEARQLWTEGSDTSAIEAQLQQFERLEMSVGDPGLAEGAAGSIFIEIPLQLTGTSKSGEALALAGTATLRRVNEVPGSSEVQRRWHIYRLDLQPRP